MKIYNQLKGIIQFQKLAAKYYPSYLWILISLTLFTAISPFINIIFPRFILDEVFGKRRIKELIFYLVLMGISTIFIGVINVVLTNKLHFLSMKLKSKLRMDMNYHTTIISYEELEDSDTLNMKQNATKFLEEDIDRAVYIAPQVFSSIIAALGYIYIISNLNLIILISLFIVIGITTALQSNTEKYAYSYREKISPIERKIAYFIMKMPDSKIGKDMRIYNLSKWFYEKYDRQLDNTFEGYKQVFSKRIQNGTLTSIVSTIQIVCIYSWLIFKTFVGGLTVGEFTMYFSSISNFSTNIMNLFSGFVQISSVKKGMEDYLNFMKIEPENNMSVQKTKLSETFNIQNAPCIEFRNVWFKYPNQNDYALKNISIKIPYGQKISVVGENGAGKTTFIKLLTRLYKPTQGQILINNIDISTLGLEQYREMFSVIFQDFSIFDFSIKENITLGNERDNNSEEKLNSTIIQTGLLSKIDSLPAGLETYVGTTFDPNGVQLSGGEFQKIALARAIYRDASILILDEPTSALDPRAEHEIYNNFYAMSRNKTTFFISHRLANSRTCDRVIVFQGGSIVEDGSHNALLEAGGIYSELYRMQQEYYNDENVETKFE